METKKQPKADKKVWLEQLAPIAKDLRLAQKRVKRVGVAHWLFQFANDNLDDFSAGQLIDSGFDLLALVIPQDLKTLDERELLAALAAAGSFMLPESANIQKLDQIVKDFKAGTISETEFVAAQQKLLNPAQPHVPAWIVRDFHKALGEKFKGFFDGRFWKHERPAETKWLIARGAQPESGAVHNAESFENPAYQLQPVERLLLIAGESVLAEQNKFGVCVRCGKPFMAIKNPRKKHCSDKCSVHLRVKRYRVKVAGNKARGKP